jgi:twitching motility protein PilT
LNELNLPPWLEEFALKPQGLIIISSPAGHGKSTTLNAMVDIINSNRRYNVVTLEDPVEYLHKHKMCNVNQREIGRDTKSFHDGLRYVLRQTPNVIVVGEMRDRESFAIALEASKTGHLVMATAHSDNSTTIIEKMINMFEPYQQGLIRSMIADSLLLSFSQRLVPSAKGTERILAHEKFINSYRMRNMIREEKIHMVRSQMQAGADDFASMDICLAGLCKKGMIRVEDALRFVEEEQFFRELLPQKLRS